MSIFFGNLFWGILIILFGISMILKDFNINIPLAKIFFGLIIILIGIRLLIGKPQCSSSRNWNSVSHSTSTGREVTMVFASGTHDLTANKFDHKHLDLTVVFGNGLVILPDDVNFVFEPTAVFGSTHIPQHPDVEGDKVYVEATAVFGRLEIQFKPSPRKKAEPTPAKSETPVTEETGF